MSSDMFSYEYVGNLHIHTKYSDGSKNISDIVKSAENAGLDFICINDHDFMKDSFDLKDEGFHDQTLVFIGLEIGKRYHHYLAYGIEKLVKSDSLSPQEVIDRVNAQGGFGFLAHPFEKGMPFIEKSIAYTWNDLSVKGYSGICLWNFSSRWKERVRSLFHGLFFMICKSLTLKGPSRETLAFWDEQCKTRRVSAIGGSDAHGKYYSWGPFGLRPLDYDFLFRTINIHILLNRKIFKDFKIAKHNIYDAIREGRGFIAHDNLFPAKGFRFNFFSDDGSDLIMGEEDHYQPGNLMVELPRVGEIRLFKDGVFEKKWNGTEAVYKVTGKGVYRVEVYLHFPIFGWRPWIFSNPIYLR